MTARGWLVAGAVSGALAVMTGAFGAHALKARLAAAQLDTWATAVQYHFYHALALIAVGLAMRLLPEVAGLHRVGWLFLFGLLAFSGSLYLLALTGVRQLGFITPLGGVAFIAGWLLLAHLLWRGLR
ncbi:MAG TPA: DUF423 domain-containing protein [Pseudomonadales bacterium]|nr:DUF423 domain-containing protein [Pseudomonadales bacterium]HMW14939.1 DUF423 domain-containing protein [Pseudomonadales bacterium]HMW83268.1 DUF423 domain-containing protein [Pseudomonadales bacterium]HMY96585.1 DUF423 domain-containing protein [Pseudomonadales bacterium]HMZ70807.1 DUF423 domain-containing protein [Pseudomonadales bacterium]